MRDWYPHRSQWDRYPLTASTRYEWDGCPSWMQVYSVFEQDGSFGASGIGTHCADAEFMRDWYPHQVHLESKTGEQGRDRNFMWLKAVSGIGTH